nr:hypothetical protein [Caballeronia insecticola]
MLDCLPLYGTLLIYSGMSGQTAKVFSPFLIFKSQSIRGFWIFNWFRTPDTKKVEAMFDELASLVSDGTLSLPVTAEFGFDRVQEAIAVASNYNGKAILKP